MAETPSAVQLEGLLDHSTPSPLRNDTSKISETPSSVQKEADAIAGRGKGNDHARKREADHKMLPPEILETILYLADPDSFASLILVDKAWRAASQTPHLYAHHLSRCPSFSLIHNVLDAGPFTDESLPRLKRRFAHEVKRNLFKAYLQPRRTTVSLISTTTCSSAAFPGGEAFEFVFSPNGHWTLALSSSRIFVIDTVSPKISVRRELKVLRRPVSAAILDDGSMLAVLSSNHKIHFYSLASQDVKHIRCIPVENAPHAIALAPKGDVIAAAYESGVGVHSLTNGAPESDWRLIKCDKVDNLHFSRDGTVLLGTTRNSANPSTVILTAPYYTDENQEIAPLDQISNMWTSQIVFPNTTRDCSHAVLLPQRKDGDSSWMFTYDRVFESFRAVRTDDLRNGTTYFTGPKRPRKDASMSPRKKFKPCTLPTANDGGELVAAGFLGKEIWLYGVPEGLDIAGVTQSDDASPQSSSAGSSTPTRTPSGGPGNPNRSMTRGEATELTRLPQWQVLVDKYRNVFAKGRKIADISGVSALTWVGHQNVELHGRHSLSERLVVAAPGGLPGDPDLEQDAFVATDGGRLIILDFDRTPVDGEFEELTIEVGSSIPELLKEEDVDMATEVALARRRTVAKNASDRRSVLTLLGSRPEMPNITLAPVANTPPQGRVADVNASVSTSSSRANSTTAIVTTRDLTRPRADSMEDGLSLEQATEVFDGPYSHTQPRSRDTLHRSATAVAANRQRNPPRILSNGRVEYRRADGRGELPHESDADNWVPPPPPYAPKADIPLPDHLRQTLLPRGTEAIPSSARPRVGRGQIQRASTMYERANTQQICTNNSSPAEVIPVLSPHAHQEHPFTSTGSSEMERAPGIMNSLSSSGLSMGDNHGQVSIGSRRTLTTSSSRRPMSEMVDRLTGSFRRPSSSSAAGASATVPSVPVIPRRHRTAPVTPRPRSPSRSLTPGLYLADGDYDQRFNIPPPPSTRDRIPTMQPRPYQASVSAVGMPSAQQLANLNKRSRQAPAPPSSHQLRTAAALSEGSIVPSPPRGALGAAGSRISIVSPTLQSPSGNPESSRSAFSRSSPSLFRPVTKRLDTIESISSRVSRSATRSRSRPQTPGNASTNGGLGRSASRRSVSAGPVLVLDRIPPAATIEDGSTKKKRFMGGRKVGRGTTADGMTIDRDRGGGTSSKRKKCTIM